MKPLMLCLVLAGMALCQEKTELQHPEDNLIIPESTETALPEEVTVSTAVDTEPRISGSISHINIDTDGIPVIEGIRLPDDPNDTKIWRNGRVLNNVLLDSDSNNSDMFIFRPESGRVLNLDDSFRPSQADSTFTPSLPFPAFYYQRYYADKSESASDRQLPDTIGVESESSATEMSLEDVANAETDADAEVDARGFLKKKNKAKKPAAYGSEFVNKGRPIYYVDPESAQSIHDDHSPYNYEPSQTQQQQPSALQYQLYQQQLLQQQQQQQQQQQLLLQQQQQQQEKPKPVDTSVPEYYQQLQLQLQQQQQLEQQKKDSEQQPKPEQQQTLSTEEYQYQLQLQQQQQQQQQQQSTLSAEEYQYQLQLQQQQQSGLSPEQYQYQLQQKPQQQPERSGFYQQQQNAFVPGQVTPVSPDNFVIHQQTYTSDGGVQYSIPIPVPQDQYQYQYSPPQQHPLNKFLRPTHLGAGQFFREQVR